MQEDVLAVLGYKVLGSRLKRLGERLQAEAQTIISDFDIEASKVGHSPLLAALDHAGALSVGELALALGQSQPGITRLVAKLKAAGLLTIDADDTDQRVKRVGLTGKGRHLVGSLKQNAWPAIEQAVAEISSGLSGPILEQLDDIEEALNSKSLTERVRNRDVPTGHRGPFVDKETLLDNPAWSAISDQQMRFTEGDMFARRFSPEYSPLAAAVDTKPQTLRRFAGLMEAERSDDVIGLILPPGTEIPEIFVKALELPIVQMVFRGPAPRKAETTDIQQLSRNDVPDILALAHVTRPGPFAARTAELGRFWGVRIDGRLAAMAGERLSMPGFTELSGVCTHPDFHGRGLASALVTHAVSDIVAKGAMPFLHVVASNERAIRLYEKLGFRERRRLQYVQLQQPA